MYEWLVFAHVLGVFGFLFAHGVAAAVAFKLRGEREIERVRILIELADGARVIGNLSLLVLLAAGVAAGFMGNWWGQLWIWSALGLLVVIAVLMTVLGSGPLERVRQLSRAAKPPASPATAVPLEDSAQAADQQLIAALAATQPRLLAIIGIGGLAIILWLMMFKPF